MKKKLMLTALVLGAGSMMLTGFDSAATAEDVMANYMEASKTISSFQADVDMNLDVGLAINMDGVNMNMYISLLGDMAMDYLKDPMSVKVDGSMTLSVPGEDTENVSMQVYMVPGDQGDWECYAYADDGSESEWEYTSIPADQMEQILALANSAELDYSQLPGTTTLAEEAADVNGITCYELTNTMTYADLEPIINQALEATGETEDTEEIQSTLSMVGMALDGVQLNTIIDIDAETYLPMKVRIDLKGSDFSMLSQILAYSFADTDDEGNAVFPEISLDLGDLYMEFIYDYTEPAEITVPEEGLAAKADSDGDDTLIELEDKLMDEIAE